MTLRTGAAMVLIGLGLAVVVMSVLGLFRFRDALERLHAGALADTMGLLLVLAGLGVLLILGGLILLCGWNGHGIKLAATLVVLWATNPISSHLIARMELITGRGIEPERRKEEGEQEL